MRLSIIAIFDRGIAGKERIALSVSVEAQLSFFAVLLSRYNGGRQTIMPGSLSSYWFPPGVAKPGDFVILYTGRGINTNEPKSTGVGMNHFFHWGHPQTIFNDPESCAVLAELATWGTSLPGG